MTTQRALRFFAGVSTDWRIRIVAGTPAGSPAVPATPNNAIKLAEISVPALDTTISTAQITDKRPRATVGGSLAPPLVTTLPASPYDGQEIRYLADDTNGLLWHLRYRTASASIYKWEFVGGSPLFAEVLTSQSTTSTSYANLTTTGPTVNAPLSGVYDVIVKTNVANNTVNAINYMSFAIGATAAVDANVAFAVTATNIGTIPAIKRSRVTVATAASDLTAKYKVSSSTGFFEYREITAMPIRVG